MGSGGEKNLLVHGFMEIGLRLERLAESIVVGMSVRAGISLVIEHIS